MTSPTADREIVITRVFDAPRELAWQAMTDPRLVVQWWGPRGFTTTIQPIGIETSRQRHLVNALRVSRKREGFGTS